MIAAGVALWFLSSPSFAADFVVKSTPCKGFIRQDGKWNPIPALPIEPGQALKVRPVSGRKDIGYIKIGEQDYTIQLKCLNAVAGKTRSQSGADAVEPSGKPKSHFYLYGGGLTWTETLAFSSSAGASHPLYATHTGGGLGAGYILPLGRHFDLSFELAGFFLVSDATSTSPSGTVNPDLNYELSSPASVFGGRFQPGIAWHTASRFFSMGVSIPLVYRIGNWPIPPTGTDASGNAITYSISGLNTFLPGGLLETRFRFGRFMLMPRGGVIGGLDNIILDVGLGLAF